ncbi:MAG: hypothetical protein WDO18_11655 [Acidobacteriota bacterium]
MLYGSSLSDSNRHLHNNLPLLLAGNAAGQIRGGRHLKMQKTPMTNLLVTMLDAMGVRQDVLGDSTGRLSL